jgi:O-glycosyl hydrolase
MPFLFLAAFTAAAAAPVEHATYDGAGNLTALICGGAKLQVRTQFIVSFEGNVDAPMQPGGSSSPIIRDGTELRWHGNIPFLNGGSATITAAWAETDQAVTLQGTLTPGSDLDVQTVDCVIDVPRAEFSGGRLEPAGVDLPVAKPDEVTFFRGTADALTFVDAGSKHSLSLKLDRPLPLTVTDRWDADGRSYRVRVTMRTGAWAQSEALKLAVALQATGDAAAPAANLSVNLAAPRYPFDGYGGNYCWSGTPAMTNFMLENLQQVWTRHELKADVWDKERTAPGGGLTDDFKMMQRMQLAGMPWIISIWNLPQRFYSDANQRPRGSFGRTIAPERWDDLLDLLGSYLVYLKQHYGAEPDLFSFNEPDLGVDIAFTPETHRDAIKRIGAHLASLGLKTKMLLGDTSDPRDTHRFVLATAADPEAMRYVGAVSFHSWGSGTPAQYAAWGDVAEWLRRPLMVTEEGVDPDAYRNHSFDNYDYGLGEAAQQQDLLRFARMNACLFWQFTADYGLVHVKPDGSIEATQRFWLMKHFTDLTPRKSQVVASASDQPDVLVSAFVRDKSAAVHVLNLGPARTSVISGLPPGAWRTVTTTDSITFAEGQTNAGATCTLALPARSLVTLTR